MDFVDQNRSSRTALADRKASLRRRPMMMAIVLFAGSLATPATAATEPSAKLVRCGVESCLRVSGERGSAAALVKINGHVVPAEGERSWKIDLPLDTVRAWSTLHARTIEVSLDDPRTDDGGSARVDLPIGLLGGVSNLASLVVSTG
jgi:hypothetical protein